MISPEGCETERVRLRQRRRPRRASSSTRPTTTTLTTKDWHRPNGGGGEERREERGESLRRRRCRRPGGAARAASPPARSETGGSLRRRPPFSLLLFAGVVFLPLVLVATAQAEAVYEAISPLSPFPPSTGGDMTADIDSEEQKGVLARRFPSALIEGGTVVPVFVRRRLGYRQWQRRFLRTMRGVRRLRGGAEETEAGADASEEERRTVVRTLSAPLETPPRVSPSQVLGTVAVRFSSLAEGTWSEIRSAPMVSHSSNSSSDRGGEGTDWSARTRRRRRRKATTETATVESTASSSGGGDEAIFAIAAGLEAAGVEVRGGGTHSSIRSLRPSNRNRDDDDSALARAAVAAVSIVLCGDTDFVLTTDAEAVALPVAVPAAAAAATTSSSNFGSGGGGSGVGAEGHAAARGWEDRCTSVGLRSAAVDAAPSDRGVLLADPSGTAVTAEDWSGAVRVEDLEVHHDDEGGTHADGEGAVAAAAGGGTGGGGEVVAYRLRWIEWSVPFLVLALPSSSLLDAGAAGYGDADDAAEEAAVRSLEREARRALTGRIRDGTFDELLQAEWEAERKADEEEGGGRGGEDDGTRTVLRTSVVGAEVQTFGEAVWRWYHRASSSYDGGERSDDIGGEEEEEESERIRTANKGNGNYEEEEDDREQDENVFVLSGDYPYPLDPEPMHPLRLAGIFLLLLTILTVAFLFALASQRKRERERDEEYRKVGRGGLVTEEGLDYMLDVGRGEAQARQAQFRASRRRQRRSGAAAAAGAVSPAAGGAAWTPPPTSAGGGSVLPLECAVPSASTLSSAAPPALARNN